MCTWGKWFSNFILAHSPEKNFTMSCQKTKQNEDVVFEFPEDTEYIIKETCEEGCVLTC